MGKLKASQSLPVNMYEEDCCGWLWKKGMFLNSWKYRFFSLRGPLLSYYDKFPTEEYSSSTDGIKNTVGITGQQSHRGDTPPRGVIRVAHVEPSALSSVAFKVYGVSGKVIDLRADTANTASRWVNRLISAARFGRRKEVVGGSIVSSTTDSVGTVESLDSLTDEDLGRMSNFVEKCGWLGQKEQKHWKNRFFVLQGNMLSIHLDDMPWSVPKSRSYVQSVFRSPHSTTSLSITLDGGKKLVVHAESREDRDRWFDALKEIAPVTV